MNHFDKAKAQISVFEDSLPVLISLKTASSESIAQVVERIARQAHTTRRKETHVQKLNCTSKPSASILGKHVVEFLGEAVSANTYGELYGRIVDIALEVDPDAIERLSNMKARSRRYVSRDAPKIHNGRPDLPVTPTKTGWHVSKNVGRKDFVRGLKALCKAADLAWEAEVKIIR